MRDDAEICGGAHIHISIKPEIKKNNNKIKQRLTISCSGKIQPKVLLFWPFLDIITVDFLLIVLVLASRNSVH